MRKTVKGVAPRSKSKLGLLFVLLSVLLLIILGFYITSIKTKNIKEAENEQSTTNIIATENNINELFVNLDKDLLRRNPTIRVEPTKGFVITTSILSNDSKQIVYSEISDCIAISNSYVRDGSICEWEYRIYIKNLISGNNKQLYPYGQALIDKAKNLFATEVNAGGCPLLKFPIAWSKNDKQIIFQWGNPTSCGSGGVPKYLTYKMNPSGGKFQDLATIDHVFINNFEKVVYIDQSEKSPSMCGPYPQANYGKIVIKNIETNKITTIAEEPNSHYSDLTLSSDQTELSYKTTKVMAVNNCSEDVTTIPTTTRTVSIR